MYSALQIKQNKPEWHQLAYVAGAERGGKRGEIIRRFLHRLGSLEGTIRSNLTKGNISLRSPNWIVLDHLNNTKNTPGSQNYPLNKGAKL